MTRSPRIALVGSINHDLVAGVEHLPRPGETIIGSSFAEVSGGKGANQAVAAARAGGKVTMIGRVGTDSFGPGLLANLADENVDTQFVTETAGPSGVAIIAVDKQGENSIIVVPGANGFVTPADVESAQKAIAASTMLMLQLEIPIDAVLAAITCAKSAGVPIMLDPAPVPRDWPADLLDVDIACPNETEAEALTGIAVVDDASAFAAADRLRELGVRTALVTRGRHGVTIVSDELRDVCRAIDIETVDTTAAGDAFAAAFAVEVARGQTLSEAVRFASVAGALAASTAGAQPSLPTRNEIISASQQP